MAAPALSRVDRAIRVSLFMMESLSFSFGFCLDPAPAVSMGSTVKLRALRKNQAGFNALLLIPA